MATTVKHSIYPTKTIPDNLVDKFIDFGWDGVTPSVDATIKASHQAKEDEFASQYAIANEITLSDAKKLVKGKIR